MFRSQVEKAGLAESVEIDSAGTHGYHVGEPPDKRSRESAARRGYDLSRLRARRVEADDFVRFDRILAMDRDNLSLLRQVCPSEHSQKLELFLRYAKGFPEEEVPDPYYGGPDGFEHVLDLVENAADGLIEALRSRK